LRNGYEKVPFFEEDQRQEEEVQKEKPRSLLDENMKEKPQGGKDVKNSHNRRNLRRKWNASRRG